MSRDEQQVLAPPNIKNMREIYHIALQEMAKPYPSVKLPRWHNFNRMTGGLRMREFSILCGPTGAGKTTLLANISEQLAEIGMKHLVMSIETGASDYMKRVLSVRERKDLNTGDPIPAAELTEITSRNLEFISSGTIEFSLYETRLAVEQLMFEIEHAVHVLGCRVVFIDNLNFLLRVTKAQDQIMEMDNVVHTLIEFVKSLDVHIWMVMHPRKTEGGRVVSEYDIKGSSTSVQEAQNVFLFNKPTLEELGKKTRSAWDRDLTIAKMRRRGMYVGKTLMFKNVGTCYEEEAFSK